MTRVKKGEKYWHIVISGADEELKLVEWIEHNDCFDEIRFNNGNYFSTREEGEMMIKKIKAVLKGAEVIDMPSEKEIREKPYDIK